MGLRRFFRRRLRDEEVNLEMENHIALECDENIARGMSGEEARRQAYVKFGSPRRVREDLWTGNSIAPLENILRDLRYAFRTLRRSPGYTLMAVLTLGFGIGANAAIFTVINGVLLRPLPYAKPAQIVHVEQTAVKVGPDPIGFSVQEVMDYRQLNHVFSDLAEYHSMTFTLLGGKEPERVNTGVVSANYFNVLGVKPVLGRLLTPADETQQAEPVLVLSYAYWVKNFGRDPKILGRTFEMNDRVHSGCKRCVHADDVMSLPLQTDDDCRPGYADVDGLRAAEAGGYDSAGSERSCDHHESAGSHLSEVVPERCRTHSAGDGR
jgi:hypothetical protein